MCDVGASTHLDRPGALSYTATSLITLASSYLRVLYFLVTRVLSFGGDSLAETLFDSRFLGSSLDASCPTEDDRAEVSSPAHLERLGAGGGLRIEQTGLSLARISSEQGPTSTPRRPTPALIASGSLHGRNGVLPTVINVSRGPLGVPLHLDLRSSSPDPNQTARFSASAQPSPRLIAGSTEQHGHRSAAVAFA